ncbi:MAG: hypothetical protein WCS31_13990 [Verrucomicrobiae bacterium]
MISNDLFDLNFPKVGEGEGPMDHPAPTFEEQIAHAEFLLATAPPDFYAARLARMNPVPFRID